MKDWKIYPRFGSAVGLLPCRRGANVLTVEGIVSFGQIIEQTDDVEQRCFAAAGFAGDGDKFALLNVQADAGQRVDGAFAFSVDFLCF